MIFMIPEQIVRIGVSIATLLALLSVLVIPHAAFGVIATLAYGASLSVWAANLFPDQGRFAPRWGRGFFLVLALLVTIGAPTYYFINLGTLATTFVVLACPLVLFAAHYVVANDLTEKLEVSTSISQPRLVWMLLALWAATIGAAFFLLMNASTTEAIRSPWTLLDVRFWTTVFLAHLFALLLVMAPPTKRSVASFVITTLAGLHIGIAAIIYRMGYGFDQFVHQATERVIIANGAISPKPLYYLGQYAITVIAARLTHLDVALIDRWLLPTLATLTLPAIAFFVAKRFTNDTRIASLASCLVLWMPLSSFLQTTPQGIANLALLGVIGTIVAFPRSKKRTLTIILLSLSSLAIHPLAGIPAAAIVWYDWAFAKSNHTWQKIIAFLVPIPCLPLAFYVAQTQLIHQAATLSPWHWPTFFFENRFQLLFDLLYQFAFNIGFWVILAATISLWVAFRRREQTVFYPALALAALLAIDWTITQRVLSFSYLISYERNAFADRLLELIVYALLPLIIYGFVQFSKRLIVAPVSIIMSGTCMMAALGTAGLYLTAPRFDTYAFDRGYSVSRHDVDTVRAIESDAAGQPYVVLSNQSVAAAALQELGFKQYFSTPTGEPMFFYPIPTGGTLYRYYLQMVYEAPTRAVVQEAMNQAGVHRAYFVLNNYWDNVEYLLPIAQASADHAWTIGENKNFIFGYQR